MQVSVTYAGMLAVLVASPFLIFCIHMVLSRISRRASHQMTAIHSVLLGYLPMTVFIGWHVMRSSESPQSVFWTAGYCFVVYSALGYTYFHFFNMSETARRIRILYEIRKAGSLSAEQIGTLYQASDVYSIRLERLLAMKQLKYENGYYSIDGRLLYAAALMMSFWRRILGFGSSHPEI